MLMQTKRHANSLPLIFVAAVLVAVCSGAARGRNDTSTKAKDANDSRQFPPATAVQSTKSPDSNECLTVDEEVRTPEGSAYVSSTIYERYGDEYKSSKKSIPVSVVNQIRELTLASETKTSPDLKDFGITEESVRSNRETMLQSAFTRFMEKHSEPHPSFEKLPKELQQLFEYETVAKNALAEITGSMNSAYDCVRISIPGDPSITLVSHHRQSGMLPWRVKAGDRTWQTYSRDLPKALAQIASPRSARYLAMDEPDHQFEDIASRNQGRGAFWPSGFFSQYGVWSRDQVESYESIEAAKKLPGWPEASKIVKIEDALKRTGGGVLIEADILDEKSVADKLRWDADRLDRRADGFLHDWNDFLTWRLRMETAAHDLQWLRKWRSAGPNRSIVAMANDNDNPCTQINNGVLQERLKHLGLAAGANYYFQLFKDGVHCRDVYIGEPYKLSLVTDLGPGGGDAWLPKIMRSKSVSVLRTHENDVELSKRITALLDQTGGVVKKSEVPLCFALDAGYPPPTAKDQSFNYGWPVDFNASEDIEYLSENEDGEEIESASPIEEPVLYGEVGKDGKVILPAEFAWIGPASDGLACIQKPGEKSGYVNQSGSIVIKPDYDQAMPFYEGLAAVCKSGKWGFINTEGEIAIPLVYDSVRRFSEGLAPAKKGAKFGYIDKSGVFVIPPQFGRARHFQKGLAYVQINDERCYIDHSGKPIGGKMYDELERFSDDRAVFKKDGKCGYIDHTGREVIGARFTDANTFRDGVAKVLESGTEKAIDTTGKLVNKPPQHSDFWEGPITEGLIRTRVDLKCDHKYGFKDRTGKFVIKPIYDEVGIFVEGLCPVALDKKWGMIDKSGNLVVKPSFDELGKEVSEHLISARTGNKWGIVDTKGATIVLPKYDRIFGFSNGFAVVQSGLLYGYINAKGEEIFAPQFDAAHMFDNHGIAHISSRVHKLDATNLP
jgi:hypothetical protein